MATCTAVHSCMLFYDVLSISQEHTGRVFRLQFDDFQIVSGSHDDTIVIWDFLGAEPGSDVFGQNKMEIEKFEECADRPPQKAHLDHVTSI